MRNEHFELHKLLKEKIRGKIFIGEKKNEVTINIVGFKGITWTLTITDMKDVEDTADMIERKYHNFILNKFFVRRDRFENKE